MTGTGAESNRVARTGPAIPQPTMRMRWCGDGIVESADVFDIILLMRGAGWMNVGCDNEIDFDDIQVENEGRSTLIYMQEYWWW